MSRAYKIWCDECKQEIKQLKIGGYEPFVNFKNDDIMLDIHKECVEELTLDNIITKLRGNATSYPHAQVTLTWMYHPTEPVTEDPWANMDSNYEDYPEEMLKKRG